MKKLYFSITILLILALGKTTAQTYATLPFYDGFEGGTYPNWLFYGNVAQVGGGVTGDCMRMRPVTDAVFSYAWADIHLDLSTETNVRMEFWMKENNAEEDRDSILFSNDGGITWYNVWAFLPETGIGSGGGNNSFNRYVLDVDEIAAANGLALTSTFVISFQWYDNRNTDEFKIDDLNIYSEPDIIAPVADICVGSAYTLLDTIQITESWVQNFDMPEGVRTLTYNAPTGYQFNPGATMTLLASSGIPGNISSPSISATASTLTVSYDVRNASDNDIDDLRLIGIEMRADATAQIDTLFRTGGSSVMFGNEVAEKRPHAYLRPVTVIDSVVGQDLACFNDSSGQATVYLPAAPGLYTISWSNGDATQVADSLKIGFAVVTVTDSNGCSEMDSVNISQPTSLTLTFTDTTMVSCNGGADGQTVISSGGGTGSISVLWESGSTSDTSSALSVGFESVTITDANGCTLSDSINITEPSVLTVSITDTTHIQCFGESVGGAVATAAGGQTAYGFDWYTNAALTISISQPSDTMKNVVAGKYYVKVTDANNCTQSDSVTITQPATGLTIAFVDSTLTRCFGDSTGTARAIASGGQGANVYLWNGGNNPNDSLNTGLKSRWYTLLVTDDSLCTATDSIFINQPPLLTVNFTDTTNVICFGDSNGVAVAAGVGGTAPYSYLWENGDNIDTSKVLKAENYTVTVTDDSACVAIDSIAITQPVNLTITFTDTFNVSCKGGNNGGAVATGVGGTAPYNHFWETGGLLDTLSGLSVGTYTDTIRDANGCTYLDSIVITEPATVLSASISDSANNSCFGENKGWAKIVPSGGNTPYTFQWYSDATLTTSLSQPVDSAINLFAGIFYGAVTDSNGCTVSDSVIITQPGSGLDFTFVDSGMVSCNGGNDGFAAIVATPGAPTDTGYVYLWSGGATPTDTLGTGFSAGTYVMVVTDTVSGCTSTDSIVITEPVSLLALDSVLSDYNGEDVSCVGSSDGSAEAYTTGGTAPYKFAWYTDPGLSVWTGDSTAIAAGLSATTYYVEITDAKGCKGDTFIVLSNPVSGITTVTSTVSSYNGEDVTCVGSTDASAEVSAGGGTGGLNYQWYSDPALTISLAQPNDTVVGIGAGMFYVKVTDANSCIAVDSVEIYDPVQVTVFDSVLSDYNGSHITCTGMSDGQLEAYATGGAGGAGPYSFVWYSNAGLTIPTGDATAITGATYGPGTYYVQVTDPNGCKDDTSVTVLDPGTIQPNLTFADPTSPAANDGYVAAHPSTATGGTGPFSHLWNYLGLTTDSIFNLPSGTYIDTITDANGCVRVDSAVILAADSLKGGIISYPGAVGGIVNVCNNNNVVNTFLDSITPTGGLGDSLYVYTWQYTTNFITWVDYPSSDTSQYYANDTVTEIKAVRRQVTDSVNTQFSNILLLVTRDSTEVSINMDPTYCDNIGDQIIFGNPSTNSTFSMSPYDADGFDSTYAPGQARLVLDSLSAGTKIVKLRHVNTYGCISTIQDTTIIFDAPNSGFAPTAKQAFTSLESPYALPTNDTVTVALVSRTFTGPGTSNGASNLFDPGIAGVGTHNLYYEVFDLNGCTDRDTLVVNINNANGTITFDSTTNVWENEVCAVNWTGFYHSVYYVDILVTGLPAMIPGSGSWSAAPALGSAVQIITDSTARFAPYYSNSGYGQDKTYTVYYTYVKADGVTVVTIEKTFTIYGRKSVFVEKDSTGSNDYSYTSVCENEAPITLVGSPFNSSSYFFNTNGANAILPESPVVNDSAGYATLYPGLAVQRDDPAYAGYPFYNRNQVYYVYRDPGASTAECLSYNYYFIYVSDIDTTAFVIKNSAVANDTAIFALNEADYPLDSVNSGYPAAGDIWEPGVAYSGLGVVPVTADSFYYSPSSVGVGTYTVSLGKTDPYGCGYYDTVIVLVQRSEANILGFDSASTYCFNGPGDTLVGVPINGLSGTGNFSGPGIVNIGPDSAVFFPTGLNGNYQIRYTFTGFDSTTTFFVDSTVYVDFIAPATILNLDTVMCASDVPFQLLGETVVGYTGTFSAINPAFVIGDSLFPASGTITTKDTVIYRFEHDITGCVIRDTGITKVQPLALVSIVGLDSQYCTSAGIINVQGLSSLSDNPTGHVFSGISNVNDSLTSINMNLLSFGDYTLNYRYTDTAGCYAETSKVFHVDTLMDLEIINLQSNYCFGQGDTIIGGRARVTGFGFLPRGYLYGNDVSELDADSTNGSATLHIDSVPAGSLSDVIYYTYTNPATGCKNTISTTVQVDTVPVVYVDSIDPFYCHEITLADQLEASHNNTGKFTISDTLGNSRSNSYIVPNVFQPSPLYIHYEVTDLHGCYNDSWDTSAIQPTPVTGFSILGNCVLDTIFFVDTSYFSVATTDSIVRWKWHFGVNSASVDSVQNPSYVYQTDGVKEVDLTVTSSSGCKSSVIDKFKFIDPLPKLKIIELEENYCNLQGDTVIIGTANDDTLGYFYGLDIIDADSTDGIAIFDIDNSNIGGVSDTIFYTYTDTLGCTDLIWALTRVDTLPNVYVTGLDSIYCNENGFQTPLTGYPVNLPSNFFMYNLDTSIFVASNAQINTVTWTPGLLYVYYKFTDGNGCFSDFLDSTDIRPTPVPDFYVTEHCIYDPILFNDTSGFAVSTSDSIVGWTWDFGDPLSDTLNVDSVQNPLHQYSTSGIKKIDLAVRSSSGCVNNIKDVEIELGSNPNVDFEWYNECFNDTVPVEFTNLSDSMTTHTIPVPSNINTYLWDFRDGVTDTVRHPDHIYGAEGGYMVKLIVSTAYQCEDSLSRLLNIRPTIKDYPYLQQFDTGNGGWYEESPNPVISWQLATPSKTLINSAYSGKKAWITDSINDYADGEKSYVVGPCFDFTTLQRPMIIMKIFNQTKLNDDGVVLQYSLNGGTTWELVGGINTGINWYNNNVTTSNPGGQIGLPVGWTGESDSNWVEVRHDLDSLAGKTNIRLRVAFSSDQNGSGEGFAFDDVWIGERSRTVLVEHFTNSYPTGTAVEDNKIDLLMAKHYKDAVDVQYHIEKPGYDQLYEDNKADASARSLYYGVYGPSTTVMDGGVDGIGYHGSTGSFQELDLRKRMLYDAPFDINVKAVINSGKSIDVTPEIVARDTMAAVDLMVHTVILEREITSLTGIGGDNNFKSVMKVMLPDATGTPISRSWLPNDAEAFTEGWGFEGKLYGSQSQLRVVVFVQNNVTKEVLQAAYLDSMVITTGAEEDLIGQGTNFGIYPNPTSSDVTIFLTKPALSGSSINVYNHLGELIEVIDVYVGTNTLTLNTINYPNGMYYISYLDGQNRIKTKKLTVQH